ncbi:MAG: hypothetical protein E7190_05745 [Erysipelotrichaceae bacterium]|nr:hypothetical protein [Erysipelotrichaceae bacterium]
MNNIMDNILKPVCAAVLCVSLAACAETSPAGTDPTPTPVPSAEPEATRSPAEISEAAMDNFVKKLDGGNYVIDHPDYLKITAVSPHQVIFDYTDEWHDDLAFVSLNGETFGGTLSEEGFTDVQYLSTDSAISCAGSRLPNCWYEMTGGNMWEIFYNNVNQPLEFQTNDDNVKMTLMNIVGYGYNALNLMHEVYMTLDAEDPSSVHFTSVVDDNPVARMYFDDIDLTLNFGDDAKGDPRVDEWLASPVYPETRTAWQEGDLFFLNSVFMPGYGERALPFPDFASYAMYIDEGVFSEYERIYLKDAHGTEKDVEHYIELLKADGFTETEETSDDKTVTVYRKPLREAYKCYAEAKPYYDNGFVLEAGPYYDNPAYDSLTGINDAITAFGFTELSENEHLTDWNATDTAAERSESWLYFFDYDLSMYAYVHYDDADAMQAYLDDYAKRLEAGGFSASWTNAGEGEKVLERYASADGQKSFRYDFNEDGETVMLTFRSEKGKTPEETEALITGAGFPEISLHTPMTVRDITRYHQMTRAFAGPLYLNVSQTFASEEEGSAFLDEYTARLEEAGYLPTNPMMVGSLKENAYYNEEKDSFAAFDFYPYEDHADIYFDFVANK